MKRKMNIYITQGSFLRGILLMVMLTTVLPSLAGSGITDYGMGAAALDQLGQWTGMMMEGVIMICYASTFFPAIFGFNYGVTDVEWNLFGIFSF